jgi:hypothetical protein
LWQQLASKVKRCNEGIIHTTSDIPDDGLELKIIFL